MDVFLAIVLALFHLLAAMLAVAKAYLELKGSGKERDDHSDAQDSNHRPKHLRG